MTTTQSQRLPRGRHGLSRSEVVRSQRTRLLRATAEAMVEHGYVGTSVADILKRAGVSRETFYQQFSSKDDCFMSAFEAAAGAVLAMGEQVELPADMPAVERFELFLGGYLDALVAEPAFARLFLVEVYAAGPEAVRRRTELQHRFVDLLIKVLDARSEEERFACETVVAAISAMVTSRLAVGDLGGLAALREPLTTLVRQATTGPLWS
jgi:AcrR family transcriptional regulator